MQLVMAATDGSEGSGRAVDMAATLAKANAAKLVVVTVTETDRIDFRIEMAKLAEAEGGSVRLWTLSPTL